MKKASVGFSQSKLLLFVVVIASGILSDGNEGYIKTRL